MKDSDRLKLIKDVSGASFYEKQREDSIVLLDEANQKSLTVNETIDSLGNQIDALSIEKKQLEVFETAERESTLLI
jgi:structural maintenance of chromosome 3 (chondroitin sulfate proteoglycan 6)